MIIGISLVVEELHKNPRLIFRYPPSVPSSILNDYEDLITFHNEYFSLAPDQVAKLFRPKLTLCNQPSEIYVHNLHYVSYPFQIPINSSDDDSSNGSGVSNDDHNISRVSVFNVIVASVRESVLRKIRYSGQYSSSNRRVTADPIATALGLGYHIVTTESIRKVLENYSMALFEEEKRCQYLSSQITLIVSIRESYSVNTMQQQQLHDIDGSAASGSADTAATESLEVDGEVYLNEYLMEQSTLANELRGLYHGLIGGHSVSLRINNVSGMFVKLNLEVPQDQVLLNDPNLTTDGNSSMLFIADADVIIQLLQKSTSREDVVAEIEVLEHGTLNPRIHSSVLQMTPLVTFNDVSAALGETIDDVLEIGKFFQRLGLARFIPVIHLDTVFVVLPTAPTDTTNRVYRIFANYFFGGKSGSNENQGLNPSSSTGKEPDESQLQLFYVLSSFNGCGLSSVIEQFPVSLRRYGVDIVIWLLRWNLIDWALVP